MDNTTEITVLGAGSYGTALAISLASSGHKTLLWGHEPEHMETLAKERANNAFLPGITFPDTLELETDLGKALAASKNVLVVVPSHVFGLVLKQAKPLLRDDARIVWATKGLEPETGRLLQDVAREQLGEKFPLAVLSGPTFAKELAAGMPTAISVAGTCTDFTHDLVELLHSPKRLRVYANDDFTGLQLGGAVKNVIAIGAGMSDGIGFGANARTALITRGLVELTRLGVALNADANTFMGMAGLGDLVLTCTDNQSRNRRFGLALGKGSDVDTAQEEIGQVVEGYRNTKEVYTLAKRLGVEMPITEQIYQVLYKGKAPVDAAKELLGREQKSETLSS
ncbi:NAD(P)H-dependent glycerol-3-phosphate dehydrogenase [Shewanella sp. 1_MG-2023]|uniref:Glycerol-3-phosphate dehydrogenase [NAD(P)+] n=1 Tax=Shewanella electrodiphila TaxID=934143 RepID=A0ABT0KU75_9GAMM|nr:MULTISPECIES: NAD(P)H-dependent glycerol-3-phosphate dehydrogenase [Shewanella]MCC4833233.1 NAD(P)H-dependent glycerol-3-phosphate dehydrogenase [Shewanella sp. 10N.7]MCL1047174.1 NAD(P)H-dependent glycerol-3-phosphate dehydrogenase [Shewanella electrodiphila]MDO6612715.1 NAD(P)H-dependent glycerol-3-phosphate dehydrogenase [Shewanella sp. 7_MG-2023]MDO6772676.1 NAD(P)H-dependent glycerol-3-phosphate dehydrogenase [Shewanella sp. 2_MG-2023]MDO6794840.1 NAD(P)H-dependent glycerol-3-phosphate